MSGMSLEEIAHMMVSDTVGFADQHPALAIGGVVLFGVTLIIERMRRS